LSKPRDSVDEGGCGEDTEVVRLRGWRNAAGFIELFPPQVPLAYHSQQISGCLTQKLTETPTFKLIKEEEGVLGRSLSRKDRRRLMQGALGSEELLTAAKKPLTGLNRCPT
jgi:hypothetical protein